MTTVRRKPGHRQHGAVLIVSLIMLVVMTLFVVSMLKTSIVELKIGGSSQVVALNFSNAEVAIDNFISRNNGRFAPFFLARPPSGAPCDRTTAGAGPCNALPPRLVGGSVAVSAIQLHCGTWTAFGTMMNENALTSLRAAQYDLRVVATGTLGGTTTLHQGLQTLAAAGSC